MGCAVSTAEDIRNVDASDQPIIVINKVLPRDLGKTSPLLPPGCQNGTSLMESPPFGVPNSESTPIN